MEAADFYYLIGELYVENRLARQKLVEAQDEINALTEYAEQMREQGASESEGIQE